MSAFSDYLLKLSVSYAVIALFYHLVLRRLTFYDANRHYLRFYSAFCFLIPLININTFVAGSQAPARVLIQSVPTISRATAPAAPVPITAPGPEMPDAPDWLLIIWAAGAVVMLGRLLLGVRSYLGIRSQSRLVSDDGVKIYHFDLPMSPFSFGKSIFYNPHLHQPDELQDMILHEYIHVRQQHSVDVIWSELICVFNWFNPFAWLIRSAIRQNLEYIADQQVLENHPDTKAYQYLLLKTAVGREFSLVNQFGYHSLKERIVMMNKNASPRGAMAVFLFILPLLALLLAAFRIDVPDKKPVRSFSIWTGGFEESKRKPKDTLHLSGLLLDAETQKPAANYTLRLYLDDQYLKSISTDGDGFYFAELAAVPDKGVMHSYTLRRDDNESDVIMGKSYQAGAHFGDAFSIMFLKPRALAGLSFTSYGVPSNAFYDTYDRENTRSQLKSYLLEALPPFSKEMQLRVEYFKLKRWPKSVITAYKGGYFDRKRQLMGYADKTKLFLNGKPASYQQINDTFKNYQFMLTEKEEKRTYNRNMGVSEIGYFTFSAYRDTPPPALVKGNAEVRDINSFDLARLQREPYMLDGFRQVYGLSSNLMPLKSDIKKVILLKGKLARYYDASLDELWWIETRPVNEVFERPDFASK